MFFFTIFAGATWSLVLILLIIFMASTVVLLLVLVQNRCKIGPTTKEIKTGRQPAIAFQKLHSDILRMLLYVYTWLL